MEMSFTKLVSDFCDSVENNASDTALLSNATGGTEMTIGENIVHGFDSPVDACESLVSCICSEAEKRNTKYAFTIANSDELDMERLKDDNYKHFIRLLVERCES